MTKKQTNITDNTQPDNQAVVVNIKKLRSIPDISVAEDTQGTISIEGYNGGVITYSQILDYLKGTEAPVEPEV